MIHDEKYMWIYILIWLASVGAMVGLMMLSGKVLPDNKVCTIIESVVITIVALGFLYLISGKKTFTYLNNQTGYTVKMLLPTLIFSFIFGLFGVVVAFSEKPPLKADWVVSLLVLAVEMFLVGIYEEACFRACACDALLPVLKNTKHPFLLTAVISGLVFGYVHVVSVDFSDTQQVLQFFLKILNLALSGAAFMLLYWKTRNLLGLAIVHGLNDFLPMFLNEIFRFKESESSEGYISGNQGTTAVYLIQLVFEIAVFIYIYKKVGPTLDYNKILEEW